MYNEDEELRFTTGKDQENATDDTEIDALNGDYTAASMDTLMNADEDLMTEEGIRDRDAEIARKVFEECRGRDETGEPKSAVAVLLGTIDSMKMSEKTIAQQAICCAVTQIRNRGSFMEFSIAFKDEKSAELKILWDHLNEYGRLAEEAINDQDAEYIASIPYIDFVFIPYGALGCYFMCISNPEFWFLQPDTGVFRGTEETDFSGPMTEIHIVVKGENIDIYESSDIDLKEIDANAMRMISERIRNEN